VPIDRIIEHNKRTGYASLCEGGLRMDSFPMKLFRKGNAKFWNPEDIDFSADAGHIAEMTEDERHLTFVLASSFMAGEESVTQDLQPFMQAMAAEGRLADEAYLAQFTFEEAKHLQGFRLWFDAIGASGDLHSYTEEGDAYDRIFKIEQPQALYALLDDPSPAAQIRASVTYNHVVEGMLALTGYFGWAKVCASRGILPGMQQLIKRIGDDERRHMAWGTFTCRRHVAADARNWDVVEQRMGELLEPAVALVTGLFTHALSQGREIPFGITVEEMTAYAVEKATRRLESIRGAVGQDVYAIDEDYSPMDLEDRFGAEDETTITKTLATAGR
jgi:ribonucleoside-diphosphate reductase beta chain